MANIKLAAEQGAGSSRKAAIAKGTSASGFSTGNVANNPPNAQMAQPVLAVGGQTREPLDYCGACGVPSSACGGHYAAPVSSAGSFKPTRGGSGFSLKE